MSIKELAKDSYVSGQKQVVVKSGEKELTLYVNELGFMQVHSIYAAARAKNEEPLVHMVVQSVTDKDGNRFTYPEVLRLKKEVAEPIFEAVIEVQSLGGERKN
ncbi:hypothetical protein GCM10027347_59030 [Larkinella harenae]